MQLTLTSEIPLNLTTGGFTQEMKAGPWSWHQLEAIDWEGVGPSHRSKALDISKKNGRISAEVQCPCPVYVHARARVFSSYFLMGSSMFSSKSSAVDLYLSTNALAGR